MSDPTHRVDRWLWHARMLRTRSMATRFAASGKLRINGVRVTKASHPVSLGDVLTFALSDRVRVLKVTAIVERRGAFSEARLTYEDLSPPIPDTPPLDAPAARLGGSGRPTKRERRHLLMLSREHP